MKQVSLRKIFISILCLFFFNGLAWADYDIKFSNTNFINNYRDTESKRNISYDYNRLRVDLDIDSSDALLHLKFIGDLESYLSDTFIDSQAFKSLQRADPALPFNPYWNILEEDYLFTRLYVYRIYTELSLSNSITSLGLQRIPFGVGRMWNPSDTFNPVDALSNESQERMGVFALNHIQYLSDFSSLQLVSSFKEKIELDKYALRYQGHHLEMDLAFSAVKDSRFYMLGTEIESNLFNTGIEVRSELAFFDNAELNKKYFSGLIGAEYAFENNITILGEYFYNGLGAKNKESYSGTLLFHGNWNFSRHYLGSTISYQVNPLTSLSLATISNLTDASFFMSPSISHSLSDESTISMGANIFTGNDDTEFERYENLYYLRIETFF